METVERRLDVEARFLFLFSSPVSCLMSLMSDIHLPMIIF